jgi:arginase family enzyme
MERPRFYKAASRLGIRTCPNGSHELNKGVETAPGAILSRDFVHSFPGSEVNNYIFPLPDNLTELEYKTLLVQHIVGFKSHIMGSLLPNERQVVIGGDHSVSLPSVLARIDRSQNLSDFGYIHFDVHPDLNQESDSPTKNFHGEYLSPLLRTFDVPAIDSMVPVKLPPENMLMIGNLDPDEGEAAFIQEAGIWHIDRADVRSNTEHTHKLIQEFIESFSHLHVSFDIDVLDRTIAPATGIPAINGFESKDIEPILRMIKSHPDFSFDLVEVNPKKPGGGKTVKTAQSILLLMLQ